MGSGGTPGYTYLWDNGETTPEATMVDPGIHFVTITDMNGCEHVVEVVINPVLAIEGESFPTTCAIDCDGTLEVMVTGGLPDYTYEWITGETSDQIEDLCPGTYSVTVIDAAGTEIIASYDVMAPEELSITADFSVFVCTDELGWIDIEVSGGTPDYSYNWSNGAFTEDISDLDPGLYFVTITDANGCELFESVDITVIDPVELVTEITDESCGGGEDGAIEIVFTIGQGPFIYEWSNGFLGPQIADLASGEYTVTVTDDNGCATTESFIVSQAGDIEVTFATDSTSCPGVSDGSIDITVTGGTLPYVFAWDNGADTEDLSDLPAGTYDIIIEDAGGCFWANSIEIFDGPGIEIDGSVSDNICFGDSVGSIDISIQSGGPAAGFTWSNSSIAEDIDGLKAGSYTVTVTSTAGCTVEGVYNVEDGEEILLSADVTAASCNGGTDGAIDLTVDGGTDPYEFKWSSGESIEDIANLAQGQYNVTVTDFNGCDAELLIDVPGAGTFEVSDVVQGIECNGSTEGSIDVTVTGGVMPYTFLWNTGAMTEDLADIGAGAYSVTITDAQLCQVVGMYTIDDVPPLVISVDTAHIACSGEATGSIALTVEGGTQPYIFKWSNGSDSDRLENLGAGSYQVTVSDVNDCFVERDFEILEPPPLQAQIVNVTNPTMGGEFGRAEVVVTGGTMPYLVEWDNGEAGTIASQLPIGITMVTITDANGCDTVLSVEITVQAFSVNYAIQNNLCFGECEGSIELTINGGLPPYTINWSNGQGGTLAEQLCSGVYAATVTDGIGSEVELSALAITSPPEILLSFDATDESCLDTDDGEVLVTPTGGTPGFDYLWSNSATDASIADLSPGLYSVTVTDELGCEAFGQAMIEEVIGLNP